MADYGFKDEISLADQAETLGKRAMKLGLIPSFVVYHYPDSWQFFIPNQNECDPLTPEEAYLRLKKLIESSGA